MRRKVDWGLWTSIGLLLGAIFVLALLVSLALGTPARAQYWADFPVCAKYKDAYAIAKKGVGFPKSHLMRNGHCATVNLPLIYLRGLAEFYDVWGDPAIVSEFTVEGKPNSRLYSVVSEPPKNIYDITWKPEYGKMSPAIQEWFENAQLTPAANLRLYYDRCCSHADRVKTEFKVSKTNGQDEWFWLDPSDNTWKQVPIDTIHDDPIVAPKGHNNDPEFIQLRAEGVLFVYLGRVTCFWPPESGG